MSTIESGTNLAELKRRALAGDRTAITMLRSSGHFDKLRENRSGYAVSSGQKRLLLLDRQEPGTSTYNMPAAAHLRGKLNTNAFRRAVQAVQLRHESLRTVFREQGDTSRQIIVPDTAPLIYLDESTSPNAEEHIRRLLSADAAEPFDLAAGPLVRAKLVKVGPEHHVFYCNLHHVIADQWSQTVLLRDTLELHRAFSSGEEPRLPTLTMQYRDYAAIQRESIGGERYRSHREYWRSKLSASLPALELPTDFQRLPERPAIAENFEHLIGAGVASALDGLRLQERATQFQILTAAAFVLFGRYSGQEDLILGTVVSGREGSDLEDQIGFFVNTLPIRIRVDSNKSFREILALTKEAAEAADRYGAYPFDEMWADLSAHRAPGRSPIFDVAVVYQEGEHDTFETDGLTVSSFELPFRTAKFDLSLYFGPTSRGLRLVLNYNTALFKRETIGRMARHFEQLLAQAATKPDAPIAEYEVVTAAEARQLISEWNDTDASYPDSTIVHLFEAEVARQRNRTAVVSDSGSLTYGELDALANGVAIALRGCRDFGPQSLIAVLMYPSERTVATLLGILKAGAAYVPMDPSYPVSRLSFIVRDAGVRIIIAESASHELAGKAVRGSDVEILDFASVRPGLSEPCPASPGDLAYVIYTSGSTGQPKGCCIEHRNVVRLMKNSRFQFRFTENDTWIVAHSFCFDFSVWEMYGALLYGGKLIVPDRELVRDTDAFRQLVKQHRVTVLNQTPAAFYNFIASERADVSHSLDAHLRLVIFGGDRLNPTLLREWASWYRPDRLLLVNMFGITETTVHASFGPLSAADINGAPNGSPIGVPLTETKIYVLNRGLRLQPVGVPGEIYVGGTGVCRGYLNRKDLNSERFIENPYQAGERLYRSGDMARWRADGTLEHLGRNDDQVQIRGYRVELREIQRALQLHPDVFNVIVVAQDTADHVKELAAYYVERAPVKPIDLVAHLAAHLPSYMIPAHFVRITEFPLTANNKIAIEQLPAPHRESNHGANIEAPRDHWEATLVQIWERVLDVPAVSIHDSYASLGGDSMKAIRLLNSIGKELQVRVTARDLYRNPTVAGLAAQIRASLENHEDQCENGRLLLEDRRRMINSDGLPENPEEYFPASDIQAGMIFHGLLDAELRVYHDQFVYEFRDDSFSVEAFTLALERMIQRHPILRTSFHFYGEPVQVVHQPMPPHVIFEDISGLDRESQRIRLEDILEADRRMGFDVARPGLWRVRILKAGSTSHAMVWSFHHAIIDGWSNALFFSELIESYFTLKHNPGHTLPPLQATYRDYVASQLAIEQNPTTKAFWKAELQSAEKCPLPLGKTVQPAGSRRKYVTKINPELVGKLSALANEEKVGVREVCLAAFSYWLTVVTGRTDLMFGVVCHGRPVVPDGDAILGCFLNSVPFRLSISGRCIPRQIIRDTHAKREQAREHETLSTRKIARLAGSETSVNPLFELLFNYIDFYVLEKLERVNQRSARALESHEVTDTPFDFSINRTFGELSVSIYYSHSTYTQAEIERLAAYYVRILEQFANNPEQSLDTRMVIGASELALVVETFNNTGSAYPCETIAALFEKQARDMPNRIAISSGSKNLTFRELNERANAVAAALSDQYGLMPEEPVALLFDRSEWTAVAMLGVLKAGGSYLPLDPAFPMAHVETIFQTAGIRYVFSCDTGLRNVQALQVGSLGKPVRDNPASQGVASSLAYIMYTSGSTGSPKGTCVEQRAVVRLVRNTNYVRLSPDDRILQAGSLAFDACTFEIWGALLNGGCAVLPQGDALSDPQLLETTIREERITVLFLTTALFNQFADSNPRMFRPLRVLLSGGEKVSAEHFNKVRAACPNLDLLHVYGPTENTTFSTYHRVDHVYGRDIPIGSAISNSTVYIVGSDLQPLPIGVPGEICTGGDGVARGYVNDDRRTASLFVPDPFRPGGRLYRTGDIGRWLECGAVEFIGRVDSQVKVRGFRVEPGEVEQHLRRHPAVVDAVVIAERNQVGTHELLGYFTARAALPVSELRDFLAQRVPKWMLPARLTALDALPIGSTGKVDRKALPRISAVEPAEMHAEQPRNEREAVLQRIWRDVLNVATAGIFDNYYDLGGDSIKALQIKSRLLQAGWKLNIRDLIDLPVIAELAPRLHMAVGTTRATGRSARFKLTPAQRWFFESHQGNLDHFNISMVLRSVQQVDLEQLQNALVRATRQHSALRLRFADQTEQSYANDSDDARFETVDLRRSETPHQEFEAAAARLQSTLSIKAGVLWRVALYRLPSEDRVVFVFHHLIADAVSCRVIAEDLNRAYSGYALYPAGTDLRDWAAYLSAYADSQGLEHQIEYWRDIIARDSGRFALDNPAGENTYRHCRSVEFALAENETARLRANAPDGDISSAILAGIGRVLRHRHGRDTHVLFEGHGRESLDTDLDVSRTVGWFTALYPSVISGTGDSVEAEARTISKMRRAIPDAGIGYGVARYLGSKKLQAKLESRVSPTVSFNYLGDFSASSGGDVFTLIGDVRAPVHPDTQRHVTIDITGAILASELRVSLAYPALQCSLSTMEQFAFDVRAELEELADASIRRPLRAKAAGPGLGETFVV